MYMLQKQKEPKFGLTCGQFSHPSIIEEHQLPKPGTSANIINNHCKLQVHSYHTKSLAAANDVLIVSTQLHREISIGERFNKMEATNANRWKINIRPAINANIVHKRCIVLPSVIYIQIHTLQSI